MERDKLLDISKGGRLQVDSSDLESESARIDQIEEELKRSVFKEKKVSKTAAVGRILVKNYAELQQGWNREKLYNATKSLKDGWDETILKAQEKGTSTEDLFKMLHDETVSAPLLSKFDQDTSGLSAGDKKEALENFKEYQKIAQRKVRRQAAVEQLKTRRLKAERGLEDLRIAVIEGKETEKSIQSRFADLVKSLGFSESDRGLYNKAAREALSRGRLDRSISNLNIEEAKKQLKLNKNKLTAREYRAYSRAVDQMPEKINQVGDAIIKNPSMELRGQYIIKHKNSLFGKIFSLEESRLQTSFSKNGSIALPSKQEYIDIALEATKGQSRAVQNKAVKRAAEAYESWKIYLRDNKREALASRIGKTEWDKLPEETKFNATGQSYDSMAERRAAGQQALMAFKNNSFVAYRNELLKRYGNDQSIVDRKLKEALLQLRRDNPKANKDAGGSYIDMLEVEITNPGTIKFNKNSIERELEKGMKIPKYADVDEAYNRNSSLAKLGNELENLVGSMPGGSAIMRTLVLQAKAFSRTAPLDENSSTPPEEQRKDIFADKLEELYQETLDNKKLFGGEGKWSRLDGVGVNGRVFLFDNSAIGSDPAKDARAQSFSRMIKNGGLVDMGVLHPSLLEMNLSNTFLQRNPKTNEIEIWGTVVNPDTGEEQQIHLVDHNGEPIRTTDAEVAAFGPESLPRNTVIKGIKYAKPYNKDLEISISDVVNQVTQGSNDPAAKQTADVIALAKIRNSGNGPGRILPRNFIHKGRNWDKATIKDQIQVVKAVEKDIKEVINSRGLFGLTSKIEGAFSEKPDPRIFKVLTSMAIEENSMIRGKFGDLNEEKIVELYETLRNVFQPNLHQSHRTPLPIKMDDVDADMLTHLYALGIGNRGRGTFKLKFLDTTLMTQEEIDDYSAVIDHSFEKGAYQWRQKGLLNQGYDFTGGNWDRNIPMKEAQRPNLK